MTVGPHLLGRTRPPDMSHLRAWSLAAAAPPQGIEVEIKRPTVSDYDQGETPECVAYSISRIVNWFNGYAFDAPWLYARCKELDGDPTGDGTNARAACDVLRTLGHVRMIAGKDVKAGAARAHGIASNHWATTVDGIRSVFARPKPQPVPIGIDWFNAWFDPARDTNGEYWLQPPRAAGSIAGGHEIGIWACSDKRQAFGLANTWGSQGWPSLVWLPYATMTQLFALGADACVITDLASR